MSNFTSTIVNFTENAGNNISLAHPSVVIKITPEAGYTVNAASFSSIAPLPTGVANVTFSQNGSNVDALVTFLPLFPMPASNLSIPLCIKSGVSGVRYSVSGNVSTNTTNTLPLTVSTYSASGEFGQTVQLMSVDAVATSGYYFPSPPLLAITSGDIADYSITATNTMNSGGFVIRRKFIVSYIFPNNDAINNSFQLTANAQVLYNPVIEITGYSFPFTKVVSTGEIRPMHLNGVQGAQYQLIYTNSNDDLMGTFSGSVGVQERLYYL